VALWSKLTGAIVGIGVGEAGAAAIEPVLEPQRQKAWQKSRARVLGLAQVAELVSKGVLDEHSAIDEASRTGYSESRLRAVVEMMLEAPAFALALTLYRRGLIAEHELDHALAKEQIEPEYWPALKATVEQLLSPSDVANAIQQGHLPNAGVLPTLPGHTPPPAGYEQPTAPDGSPPTSVPLTTIELDTLREAAGHGVDKERLQVLANLAGLPPGAHDLLQMWNRNLIDEAAVDAGVREGHLKTKWLPAFKRMRWAVLSPQEYASAALRQWVTKDEMYEGGALTGHTREQMELMFLNRGRPASPTQMWRAWARKAKGPRGVPAAFEDHAKAIAISDIRPEYAELLWEIRFNYPSLFQLNRLVDAGTVTPAIAAEWAEKNLYAPEVVDALRAAWAKGSSGAGGGETRAEAAAEFEAGYISEAEYRTLLEGHGVSGPALDRLVHLGDARRAKKYRDRVVDAIGNAYTSFRLDDARAVAELAEVHIGADAAASLLSVWGKLRLDRVRLLSDTELRKAYAGNRISRPDALDELEHRGYSPADAGLYLDNVAPPASAQP
jgi:hypothetical protein